MAARKAPPFLSSAQQRIAAAIARLIYVNPFLPERVECERQALGADFIPTGAVWSIRASPDSRNPNLPRLGQVAEIHAEMLRERLARAAGISPAEIDLYGDLVLYLLYHRHRDALESAVSGRCGSRLGFYSTFAREAERFFGIPGVRFETLNELPHIFACFFQVQRAFLHTFSNIAGGSLPAARLRAAVWQSIFSHDMRRYRRSLHKRMGDITTLVTGPSGTGKELVARAISLSRYIPFDPHSQSFSEDFDGSFHALNLSALSPTLIESELFGHQRGAFTGAIQDRAGWLEVCPPLGTVFLDEIGDLDVTLQVKLLGVLQTREFQRLGESRTRRFAGKVIAATNRDLAQEMRSGRFREDLYYRLCSDMIVTPSLAEQLEESPGELRGLILFIAKRVIGDEEAEPLAAEVEAWIANHLGRDYLWPGNVRELEQCVRNVLLRKEYHPSHHRRGAEAIDPCDELAQSLRDGALTADDLLRRYATLVFALTGTYEGAARRLGLDRRTVKAKVDQEMLEKLRPGPKA